MGKQLVVYKPKPKKKAPRVIKASMTNLESIGIQWTTEQFKLIRNYL